MADLEKILDELAAEHDALDRIVAGLDEIGWETSTPAEGWNIRDQVAHLAFFDDQATLAMNDPDGFSRALEEIAKDIGAYMDRSVEKGRELGNRGVLEWWRSARAAMLEEGRRVPAGTRIAWYGPPMSPASFFSARIMETWAHAQDAADALGIQREVSPRIKNVVHLCVLSRTHSYAANGLPAPVGDVRVTLTGPSEDPWVWGNDASPDRITGTAEDFCLVVTQRRHPYDTALVIEGDEARKWMSVAQAYAGPPGSGREPGQFPRSSS